MRKVAETIALTGPHPVARLGYMTPWRRTPGWCVEGICAAVRVPSTVPLALLADALCDPNPPPCPGRGGGRARHWAPPARSARVEAEGRTRSAAATPNTLSAARGEVLTLA